MSGSGAGRRVVCALLLASLVAAAGCRSTIAAGVAPDSEPISEEAYAHARAFFREPLLSHVTLSPDGEHIAGILAKEGVEVLIVRPTRGGEIRTLAKLERTRFTRSWAVNRVGWGSNEQLLVSIQMPSEAAVGVRARQTRLLVVDLAGGRPRYLGDDWRFDADMQAQDDVISWLPDEPDHILVNLVLPPDPGAGARRVNIHSGALSTAVSPRAGVHGWYADHREEVRVGIGRPRTGTDVFLYARTSGDGSFEEIRRWDAHDGSGFGFIGFDQDPDTIYVSRYDENGRLAVYRFSISARELGEKVFSHPEVDAYSIKTSSLDGHLIAAGYVTQKPHLQFFDRVWQAVQQAIDRELPGRINRFVSADREERRLIVRSEGDIHPPRFYLYDRETRRLDLLFNAYPELENARLAPMQAVEYAARDGLVIPAYLTKPVGRVKPPYPTVILPHGGPWERDVWGWDAEVQYLASLGFAVLQPNFRGSDGYGREFFDRGIGTWGEAMQDDLGDGARWLVEQGIADPQRIGIYGVSYGGFAALLALAKEPELFRAGASFAGVTDLLTTLSDDDWYANGLEDMERLVGSRWGDRERLRSISPVEQVGRIRAPVLVAHGTQDPRVHVKQATAMIDALEDAGVEVTPLLYEGEVHGFLDERNAIDFHARLGAFFQRHLAPPAVAAQP